MLVRATATPLESESSGSAGLQKKEAAKIGPTQSLDNGAESAQFFRWRGPPIALEEEEQWLVMTVLYVHRNLSSIKERMLGSGARLDDGVRSLDVHAWAAHIAANHVAANHQPTLRPSVRSR